MSDQMPSEDSSMRIAKALEQCCLEFVQELEAIESPHELHRRKVAEIRANIEQIKSYILSKHDLAQQDSLVNSVFEHGRHLERLESRHQVTVHDEEQACERRRRVVLDRRCRDLIKIMGLSLVRSTLDAISNEEQPSRGRKDTETGPTQLPTPSGVESEAITQENSTDDIKHTRSRKRKRGDHHKRQGAEPVTCPTPGSVYIGRWGKNRKAWAVLLLPTENLRSVGVPGTMQSLGLADALPDCYSYNKRTKRFQWADGYEDGGRLVHQRQFPVMYFNRPSFPERTKVDWLGVKDLEEIDATSAAANGIPHIETVREYLQDWKREEDSDSNHPDPSDEAEYEAGPALSPCSQRDLQSSDSLKDHVPEGPEAETQDNTFEDKEPPLAPVQQPTLLDNHLGSAANETLPQHPDHISIGSSIPSHGFETFPDSPSHKIQDGGAFTAPDGPSEPTRAHRASNEAGTCSSADPGQPANADAGVSSATCPLDHTSGFDQTYLVDIAREGLTRQPTMPSFRNIQPKPAHSQVQTMPSTHIPTVNTFPPEDEHFEYRGSTNGCTRAAQSSTATSTPREGLIQQPDGAETMQPDPVQSQRVSNAPEPPSPHTQLGDMPAETEWHQARGSWHAQSGPSPYPAPCPPPVQSQAPQAQPHQYAYELPPREQSTGNVQPAPTPASHHIPQGRSFDAPPNPDAHHREATGTTRPVQHAAPNTMSQQNQGGPANPQVTETSSTSKRLPPIRFMKPVCYAAPRNGVASQTHSSFREAGAHKNIVSSPFPYGKSTGMSQPAESRFSKDGWAGRAPGPRVLGEPNPWVT